MKSLFTFLIVTLLTLNTSAAETTPAWCESLLQQFDYKKPEVTIPVELQTTVNEAVERATLLTEENGITSVNVTYKFIGTITGTPGEELNGLEVEITDEGGWSQGNGMFFKFSIKKTTDKIVTDLLTHGDVWHIGPPNISGDACEQN